MFTGARCALFLLIFGSHARTALALALLLTLAGAIVYSFLSIIAAWRYLSVRPPALRAAEPISILKPLAGLDLDLESNLRTFFEQEYPAFEILFAVRDAKDLAAGVVSRLQKEYPRVPSRLIVTGEPPYANAKVYSLTHMLAAAANDLVVMSDSDIRVTPHLLQTIAAEFQDPGFPKSRFQDVKIGVATCPYRVVPGGSFWSALEATGINTDFWASALVARMIEGMHFAVGPTIAARRSVLHAIGGMDRLREYLAEDFVMGKFAAEAGYGVILSSYVIEHHIGSATWRENIAHRLRWTRSTRRSRPAGYIGQLFTMPFPLALLVCIAAPAWWPAIPMTFIVRALAAYVVSSRVLHTRINWLLLPLEDLINFCFWIAGFFGNTIAWRGRRYRLFADGRFAPMPASRTEN